MYNSFYPFQKQNPLILLTRKCNENLSRGLIIIKNCIDFPFIIFHFSFQIFFIVHLFPNKSFLILSPTLSQILLYFFYQLIIFHQKRSLFSFMKTFYIFSYFGSIIHNGLIIIIIFATSTIFVTSFIKKHCLISKFRKYLHHLSKLVFYDSKTHVY